MLQFSVNRLNLVRAWGTALDIKSIAVEVIHSLVSLEGALIEILHSASTEMASR